VEDSPKEDSYLWNLNPDVIDPIVRCLRDEGSIVIGLLNLFPRASLTRVSGSLLSICLLNFFLKIRCWREAGSALSATC